MELMDRKIRNVVAVMREELGCTNRRANVDLYAIREDIRMVY